MVLNIICSLGWVWLWCGGLGGCIWRWRLLWRWSLFTTDLMFGRLCEEGFVTLVGLEAGISVLRYACDSACHFPLTGPGVWRRGYFVLVGSQVGSLGYVERLGISLEYLRLVVSAVEAAGWCLELLLNGETDPGLGPYEVGMICGASSRLETGYWRLPHSLCWLLRVFLIPAVGAGKT